MGRFISQEDLSNELAIKANLDKISLTGVPITPKHSEEFNLIRPEMTDIIITDEGGV